MLKYMWTETEIEYLTQSYSYETVKGIATTLGKTETEVKAVVCRLLRRADLGRKKWKYKTQQSLHILERAKQEEIIYLAGLVDGEGTISLASCRGYYRPFCCITTTDPLLIAWLKRFFWQKETHCKNQRNRPYVKAVLTGYGITPFLNALEPYLVIKKVHCQILRSYIALRLSQKWKEKPSTEMECLRGDLRILNAVGRQTDSAKAFVRRRYGQSDV